jgi:hypothetical protein
VQSRHGGTMSRLSWSMSLWRPRTRMESSSSLVTPASLTGLTGTRQQRKTRSSLATEFG